MTKDQIVTIDVLEKFRYDLLEDIKELLETRQPEASKPWLKSAEVCKLLGVSPGKLQTMRNNKVVAFTRIGGNIYYARDDIEKMFESRRTTSK